jgi:hypothetical protein
MSRLFNDRHLFEQLRHRHAQRFGDGVQPVQLESSGLVAVHNLGDGRPTYARQLFEV